MIREGYHLEITIAIQIVAGCRASLVRFSIEARFEMGEVLLTASIFEVLS